MINSSATTHKRAPMILTDFFISLLQWRTGFCMIAQKYCNHARRQRGHGDIPIGVNDGLNTFRSRRIREITAMKTHYTFFRNEPKLNHSNANGLMLDAQL